MSNAKVMEKFEQLFGSHPDFEELLYLLNTYDSREGSREVARVQLAILKLSEGSPEKLRINLEAALIDYRDVLAWAEYPEQMRSGKTAYNAPIEEYEEILRRDREQYIEWLEDRED